MNLDSIAEKLSETRKKLLRPAETAHNKSDLFLKEICVLIPNDLMHSPNLFWKPPFVRIAACRERVSTDEYFLRRFVDVLDMCERVMMWYDMHSPTQEDIGFENHELFSSLRRWFKNVETVAKELETKNKRRIENEKSNSECCDCCCDGTETNSHNNRNGYRSAGSNYVFCGYCGCFHCNDCCELCFCCTRGCAKCVIESQLQHNQSVGVRSQVDGEGYSGGVAGYFNGESEGYRAAECNEICYTWQSHTCGKDFANVCCYCHNADKGTAAAMSGGDAPNDCCGQCAYYSTNSHESFRGCLCGSLGKIFSHCGSCLSGCFNLSSDICSACYQDGANFVVDRFNCAFEICGFKDFDFIRFIFGLGELIIYGFNNVVELCGDFFQVVFGFFRGCDCGPCEQIGNGCLRCITSISDCNIPCNCNGCDCNGCGDKVMEGFVAVIGFFCAAAATIYDAVGGNSGGDNNDDMMMTNTTAFSTIDNSNINRRLAETGSEYIPSIIFMVTCLIVFMPRVLASLLYASINVYEGLAIQKSMKILSTMLLIALPCAIVLSTFGRASSYTYVSLILMFMHFSYKASSRYYKEPHPDIIDTSYLSTSEWRSLREQVLKDNSNVSSIVQNLTRHREYLRVNMDEYKNGPISSTFWALFPTVLKTIVRFNISRKVAHTLEVLLTTDEEYNISLQVREAGRRNDVNEDSTVQGEPQFVDTEAVSYPESVVVSPSTTTQSPNRNDQRIHNNDLDIPQAQVIDDR